MTADLPPAKGDASEGSLKTILPPLLLGAAAFVLLFYEPAVTLARDWWNDPDASHGLLLGPLAVFLAWRRGIVEGAAPSPALGVAVVAGAVGLRFVSELAAELFTMRFSMLLAVAGIVVLLFGLRQLLHWWIPVALLGLSIPLPDMVLNTVAFPLQLRASAMGAALLEWRHVPVQLAGNVIQLPGHSLFVTEACSGLRSLTALLSIGVLAGGLFLQTPVGRGIVLLLTIPVAMVINGIRVFLTGFLVFFVDPELGTGFMHYSEGWALFVISLLILGAFTWVLSRGEAWWRSGNLAMEAS